MRSLVFILAVVGFVSAEFVEINTNYFDAVGIPLAEKIRAHEDEIHSNIDNRIVGGSVASLGSHPYLAGLVVSMLPSGTGVCGSSMLSANRLITAAHCWFDGVRQAWQFEVVLGSQFLFYGGERITTSQVIMHGQWFPSLLMNDVAMIYLPRNVIYTTSIFPAALPSGLDLFDTFAGQVATTAGYGLTSDAGTGVTLDTQVREVSAAVITVAACQAVYGSAFVTSSTICTAGTGSVGVCGGDSGGPLVVRRNGVSTLIGVTSFAASGACTHGHPSGFARVTSFYNFILQHMA